MIIMKLFRLLPASIIVLSFLFSSCAKEESVSGEAIQKNLLDAYMVVTYGKDRNTWPVQAEMGYYYIPIRTAASGATPADNKWIRYDISSKTQDGTLIYTSSKDVAKQYNTFSYFTYYRPDYYAMGDDHGYIPTGIADAMKKYTKVGDSIRLIMYPNIAAGNSYLSSVSTGKPVILDIAIRDVVSLPESNEEEELLNYKQAYYSSAVPLKGKSGADTTGIFFQVITPQPIPDDVVVADNDTVWVKYTGRYLNGYMFDTNIIDSAKKYNIYSYNVEKYASTGLEVIISNSNSETGSSSGSVVAGFEAAIRNMKAGSSAVVMFTSPWGYGVLGKDNAGPNYASMVFYISLLKIGKHSTE